MYVCICKNVTDQQIRKAVFEHRVHSVRELRSCMGACDQCGKCAVEAKLIIKETTQERELLENQALRLN